MANDTPAPGHGEDTREEVLAPPDPSRRAETLTSPPAGSRHLLELLAQLGRDELALVQTAVEGMVTRRLRHVDVDHAVDLVHLGLPVPAATAWLRSR